MDHEARLRFLATMRAFCFFKIIVGGVSIVHQQQRPTDIASAGHRAGAQFTPGLQKSGRAGKSLAHGEQVVRQFREINSLSGDAFHGKLPTTGSAKAEKSGKASQVVTPNSSSRRGHTNRPLAHAWANAIPEPKKFGSILKEALGLDSFNFNKVKPAVANGAERVKVEKARSVDDPEDAYKLLDIEPHEQSDMLPEWSESSGAEADLQAEAAAAMLAGASAEGEADAEWWELGPRPQPVLEQVPFAQEEPQPETEGEDPDSPYNSSADEVAPEEGEDPQLEGEASPKVEASTEGSNSDANRPGEDDAGAADSVPDSGGEAGFAVLASQADEGNNGFGDPFASESILKAASTSCSGAENLDSWLERSENVSNFISVWRRARPGSIIQIDDGQTGCNVEGNTNDNEPGKHILNLIHRSPQKICLAESDMKDEDQFYDMPQHFFNVTGPMEQLNKVRSYGAVWPAVCAQRDARCPLVISLQGVNEHAAFVRNWYDFQIMANTGLLHTVQRDPECMRSLSTVLLFPQLLQGESWVRDGPMILDNFLVPLTLYFLEKYTGIQEIRRVSIVGYSEGAFGVLTAVTRYPQIFEFGAAIAVSLNSTSWEKVKKPVPAMTSRQWRLKAIVLAFGEKDASGDQSINLENSLNMLEAANMTRVPVVARLYAGIGHNHWENVFNKWPAFHEIIWHGDASKLI